MIKYSVIGLAWASVTLMAQTPAAAPSKICVINLQSAMVATKEGQAAAETFRTKFQEPKEKDLQAKAAHLESQRDELAKHGPPLGFAIASLQVAIALASVCLITKRKLLWGASGLLGAIGIAYLIYGLYLV